MTLTQIRTEIWEGLGELTDLDPSADPTRLNLIVNEGYRRVCFWKDPVTGRHVRFRACFGEMNYYSSTVTDTVSSSNNTTFPYYIDLTGTNVGAQNDRYNDWVIEITSGNEDGEKRFITDYDAANYRVYFTDDFTTGVSAADTVKLYKNFDRLLPSSHAWVDDHIALPATNDLYLNDGNFLEVLRLVDINKEVEIGRAHSVELFTNYTTAAGDPSEWYRLGNRIVYDKAVDEDKSFHMEYYRAPTALSNANDVPNIPEQFHYAIVLWGLEWGYRRGMESNHKYSVKMDFREYMNSVVGQYDVESARTNGKVSIKWQ